MTFTAARTRLARQVAAMTRTGQHYRVVSMILSTNIRFTASGARDQNVSRREPDDPGVAFYFDLDGKPHVLACDRWDSVADNIAAIAAHIEALRGQERWGVADLRQAFAGHVALAAPAAAHGWRSTLGFSATARVTAADVDARYRDLAAARHPDRGGSVEAMTTLNIARDAAKKELSRG
ncbi:hypothetical protein [Sphingomonas sp. Leaf343]|uniref:hypothetical protein n=1 Tax=Sphingomonas sp. Leaf343 TaxID=1736345 RepID=UPI0006F8D12D|nr:hypothetical protein [Sphingomonas sp. Leaf343]KQR83486.1 hypothetical protein ASG07_07095 [Sphingomonas sp. Leaf343]